jgi:pyruvate dehydrogenase E2 component (dihydrolipoamide acetyltransferase)
LTQVKGSGENGRIVKKRHRISLLPPTSAAPAAAAKQLLLLHPLKVFVPAGEVFTEEIKNSQMRKIIKRLVFIYCASLQLNYRSYDG